MRLKLALMMLTVVAMMPLRVLYVVSDFIAFVLHRLMRYRLRLVRENLAASFPEKSTAELRQIEKRYYGFIGDIAAETVKLLHISDAEMKRRVEVIDYELVNRELVGNRSVVIMLGHYGNWEWAQEMAVYFPDVCKGSIYHPMKSRLWDEIYLKIRGRWGHLLLAQQQAPRFLLDRKNQPWVFGFIADQRPKGASRKGHTMFLNHETDFITGPEEIGARMKAAFVYLDIERPKRGYYRLTFKPLEAAEGVASYPHTVRFWEEFEKTLKRDPALWLWSHDRWSIRKRWKQPSPTSSC